jgi:hypothetical protein
MSRNGVNTAVGNTSLMTTAPRANAMALKVSNHFVELFYRPLDEVVDFSLASQFPDFSLASQFPINIL